MQYYIKMAKYGLFIKNVYGKYQLHKTYKTELSAKIVKTKLQKITSLQIKVREI